jgi:hypothetical protein
MSTRRHSSTPARPTADDWRRGFGEPDLEDEVPRSVAVSPPSPVSTAGVFEGADDHGVVKVVVDGSGLVADVVLPRTWRERVAPGGLGQALLTAANNALSGWVADMFEHMDLGSDTPRIARADAVDAGRDPSGRVARDLVDEIRELFATFDRDLEDYRDQLEKAAGHVAEGCGSNSRIHVSMTPGQVSRVTADVRWAAHARYTEIRAEALGAFQAAGQQLAGADPGTVPLPASLARLRELAGDPTALSRQLGLS